MALVVQVWKAGEPRWLGSWRDSRSKPVQRTIGPAWLSPTPTTGNVFVDRERERQAKDQHREAWRRSWTKRKGRGAEGFLDERSAVLALRALILEREQDIDQRRQPRGSAAAPRVGRAPR